MKPFQTLTQFLESSMRSSLTEVKDTASGKDKDAIYTGSDRDRFKDYPDIFGSDPLLS